MSPTSSITKRFSTILAALAAAAAAAASCALAGRSAYGTPKMQQGDFVLTRDANDPIAVSEAKPLILPYLFADFDLFATVDVHEESELDLVFRSVGPMPRRTDRGVEVAEFHARYHLLRMSARESGPVYRSRDEALFDEEMSGGVKLRPGVPASVHLQGRGNRVRANVAGRWLPWVATADRFGEFAFVAHGGASEVAYLKIEHRSRAPRSAALAVGLLCALLWLACGQLGAPSSRLLIGAAILPAGGLFADAVFRHLAPWTEPSHIGLCCAGLLAAPLAFAVATPRASSLRAAAGVLGMFVLLEVTVRVEEARLEPLEDARLRLYFGPESGTAPFDALAKRMRSKTHVHTVDFRGPPILYAGGSAIFEAGADPFASDGGVQYAGLRTTIELRARGGVPNESVIVPTKNAHAFQQLLMIRHFYIDRFKIAGVVFGVGGTESGGDERVPPREFYAQVRDGRGLGTSTSRALALFERARPGVAPVSGPAELAETLREVHAMCESRNQSLAFVSDAFIEPALGEVMARTAGELGVPYFPNYVTEDLRPNVAGVVEFLLRSLPRKHGR